MKQEAIALLKTVLYGEANVHSNSLPSVSASLNWIATELDNIGYFLENKRVTDILSGNSPEAISYNFERFTNSKPPVDFSYKAPYSTLHHPATTLNSILCEGNGELMSKWIYVTINKLKGKFALDYGNFKNINKIEGSLDKNGTIFLTFMSKYFNTLITLDYKKSGTLHIEYKFTKEVFEQPFVLYTGIYSMIEDLLDQVLNANPQTNTVNHCLVSIEEFTNRIFEIMTTVTNDNYPWLDSKVYEVPDLYTTIPITVNVSEYESIQIGDIETIEVGSRISLEYYLQSSSKYIVTQEGNRYLPLFIVEKTLDQITNFFEGIKK